MTSLKIDENLTYYVSVNKYGLLERIFKSSNDDSHISNEINKFCPDSYIVDRFMKDDMFVTMDNKLIKCGAGTEINNYLRLSDNPNFLKLYGVWEYNEYKCIILEYLDGVVTFDGLHVGDYLSGHSPKNTFLLIVRQSFNALAHLNSKGMIHGDISNPRNMLYQFSNDRVIMIDLESDYYFDPENLSKKDKRHIKNDQRNLALILWLLIDDNISLEICEAMSNDNYMSLIELINEKKDEHLHIANVLDILTSCWNNDFYPTSHYVSLLNSCG